LQNWGAPVRPLKMPGCVKNEGGYRTFPVPAFHPCPCGAAI